MEKQLIMSVKHSFRTGIWDHCRYVTCRQKPYDEMARHLERMHRAGVALADIYLPEVISLDDYCRAAENSGMAVEARVTAAWGNPQAVRRTLPESEWQRMEKTLGIRLAGPCGNHPDNREAFCRAVRELAQQYEGRLESIHLDFIRNDNALTLMEFPCRCEACQALYERYFGTKILTPDLLQNPAVIYKLNALRCRNIRKTVEALRCIVREHKMRLTIAARANLVNSPDITVPPVWGLGPAVLEGQDWAEWAEEGLIDELFPMNYHTETALFKKVLEDHLRILGPLAPSMLYPGVGVESSMGINPPEAVAERLSLIRQAGLPGAMLFNKTNIYSDEHCRVIREYSC